MQVDSTAPAEKPVVPRIAKVKVSPLVGRRPRNVRVYLEKRRVSFAYDWCQLTKRALQWLAENEISPTWVKLYTDISDRVGIARSFKQETSGVSVAARVSSPRELLEMIERVEREPERFAIEATVVEPGSSDGHEANGTGSD